ncbi:MAG: AtpZ/AtpI family protein [Fidelibacterota bacterium]
MTSDQDSENFFARSFRYFQQYLLQSGPAIGAAYTLLGAILLLGIIGYGLDKLFDTGPLWSLIGLGVGLMVGFWQLGKMMLKK